VGTRKEQKVGGSSQVVVNNIRSKTKDRGGRKCTLVQFSGEVNMAMGSAQKDRVKKKKGGVTSTGRWPGWTSFALSGNNKKSSFVLEHSGGKEDQKKKKRNEGQVAARVAVPTRGGLGT